MNSTTVNDSEASDAARFADLGLSSEILRDLDDLGFERPTPIQSEAIPVVLEGRDVIGLAQTGTGKTAAFVLPIIERLGPDGGLRALVLSPTRELTEQIHECVGKMGGTTGFWSCCMHGGGWMTG